MALIISEPCRIWIDENIDDGLAEGKTPTAIGDQETCIEREAAEGGFYADNCPTG
jgi:hypothetical protein